MSTPLTVYKSHLPSQEHSEKFKVKPLFICRILPLRVLNLLPVQSIRIEILSVRREAKNRSKVARCTLWNKDSTKTWISRSKKSLLILSSTVLYLQITHQNNRMAENSLNLTSQEGLLLANKTRLCLRTPRRGRGRMLVRRHGNKSTVLSRNKIEIMRSTSKKLMFLCPRISKAQTNN